MVAPLGRAPSKVSDDPKTGSIVAESAIEEDKVDTNISFMLWVKGGFLALFVVGIPILIGVFSPDSEVPRVSLDEDAILFGKTRANGHAHAALWYMCWGPNLIYLVIQIGTASQLAPKLGYDMIQERSVDVNIKESMRSNLTSQGLIAALFLTVVYAMLQADPPTDEVSAIINQWYVCLLLSAAFLTMVALSVSVICLIYIEPLNDRAALHLIDS